MVRPAKPATSSRNLIKTLLQTAVFWVVFLFVIPWFIVSTERALGGHGFTFENQGKVATSFFLLASVLGLWSGSTMAIKGMGTPLPTDTARLLVISGPYRFVRNPMACAGLAQGACIGIWAGSWPILAYVVTGFIVWNFLVRPVEEAELHERFSEPFLAYQRNVRCWIPRLTPYVPDEVALDDQVE